MYVATPHEEHLRLLQFLAHYPHEARRYYVYGHTIPNAQPFFSDSELLSVALLLQSPFRSHARLPELLRIEGQPVELLWVQPITEAELTVKRQHGIDALLNLFSQHRVQEGFPRPALWHNGGLLDPIAQVFAWRSSKEAPQLAPWYRALTGRDPFFG